MPSHAQTRMNVRDGAVPTVLASATPGRNPTDKHTHHEAEPAQSHRSSVACAATTARQADVLARPRSHVAHPRCWVKRRK